MRMGPRQVGEPSQPSWPVRVVVGALVTVPGLVSMPGLHDTRMPGSSGCSTSTTATPARLRTMRSVASAVSRSWRRLRSLAVDLPGDGRTEHTDAPACEDRPDDSTGCAVQVPRHEASQDECPGDQAPDDPHGVGRPVLHWPAPRGRPGTHLMQEGPHGTARRIAGSGAVA